MGERHPETVLGRVWRRERGNATARAAPTSVISYRGSHPATRSRLWPPGIRLALHHPIEWPPLSHLWTTVLSRPPSGRAVVFGGTRARSSPLTNPDGRARRVKECPKACVAPPPTPAGAAQFPTELRPMTGAEATADRPQGRVRIRHSALPADAVVVPREGESPVAGQGVIRQSVGCRVQTAAGAPDPRTTGETLQHRAHHVDGAAGALQAEVLCHLAGPQRLISLPDNDEHPIGVGQPPPSLRQLRHRLVRYDRRRLRPGRLLGPVRSRAPRGRLGLRIPRVTPAATVLAALPAAVFFAPAAGGFCPFGPGASATPPRPPAATLLAARPFQRRSSTGCSSFPPPSPPERQPVLQRPPSARQARRRRRALRAHPYQRMSHQPPVQEQPPDPPANRPEPRAASSGRSPHGTTSRPTAV